MAKSPGSTAPGSTVTTRSPGAKLWAPQTMPCGSPLPLASPTSTVHQLIVLPFFCGSGSMVSTRPITSGSVISSLVVPAGTSTRSRIQDRGAVIARSPLSDLGAERAAEPDVALEERSQVLQVVAEHERTVDAHAEREAAVDLR